MTYVLQMKPATIRASGFVRSTMRLRIGALSTASFGQLLMAESHFVRVFPEWESTDSFWWTPARAGRRGDRAAGSRLADFGWIRSTANVSPVFTALNILIFTFQMLGGLGLVLGTFGLGAVLLRNVLERRRELALLRALGYRQVEFFAMVMAENVLLLVCGLAIGTSCALLAIAPTFLDRGGWEPSGSLGLLLAGVLMTGLLASLGATAAALRSPLLSALRTE